MLKKWINLIVVIENDQIKYIKGPEDYFNHLINKESTISQIIF